MQKEEAIKIIEQVCAQFRGTLQEHQAIQTALAVIKTLEEKKEEKKDK